MRNTTITSKRGILLLTISLCFSPINAALNNDQQHFLQHNYVKNGLIIPGLLAALYVTAPEEIQDQLTEQLKINNLAKNFLTEFSSQAFATFCHEQGHALAAEYFSGKPAKVHIGSHDNHAKPFYSIGNIHLNGTNPDIGYTSHFPVNNKLHEALILLAGGAGGLVGHHGLKFLNTYAENISLGQKDALLKALSEAKKLDDTSMLEIFNALVPLSEDSDATKFWQNCVGIPPEIIDEILKNSSDIQQKLRLWLQSEEHSHSKNIELSEKISLALNDASLPIHTRLLGQLLEHQLHTAIK